MDCGYGDEPDEWEDGVVGGVVFEDGVVDEDGGREISKTRRGRGAARAGWMGWASRFVLDCVYGNEPRERKDGVVGGVVFEDGVFGVRVYSLSKSENATVLMAGEGDV